MNGKQWTVWLFIFGLLNAPINLYASDNEAVQRVDAILPLNLKQYTAAINQEKAFAALVKANMRQRKPDPLLARAYGALREIRGNPNDLASNEILCDAYKQTGHVSAAAKQCREVLKINPADALAKTAIAEIAFRSGKAGAAEGLLNEVLRDNPHYSPANLLLAEIAKSRGDTTSAANQIGQALQSNPDANALLAMGDLQMQSTQYDQAMNSYLKVLQIDPQNTLALTHLSNLFAGQGDYARALDFAQKAAASDANSALAQYTLGTQYEQSGRLEEAAVSYARATQLDPNFALAHRALGMALLKKGSPVDALTSLNRALQLSPNDPVVMEAQARAYASTGNQNYADAIQNKIQDLDYSKGEPNAAQVQPSTPADAAKAGLNLRAKAQAAETKGQYEQARQYYEQMAISDPQNPENFHNIGRIYGIAQQWDLAKRFYNTALQRNPNYAPSLLELGKVQCFQGDAQNAWQNYSKAQSLGAVDNNGATQQYLNRYCPTKRSGV